MEADPTVKPADDEIYISEIIVEVDGIRETQFHALRFPNRSAIYPEVIGRVGVSTVPPVASMRQLFVAEKFRYRGIGSQLVQACKGAARRDGCEALNLSLNPMNHHLGRKFYEPRGFSLAAEFADGDRCYAINLKRP